MIQIELYTAIVLYTGIIGVLVLAIWIYTEVSVYRPQRFLGRQYLWRCLFCGYSYLDEHAKDVSECPRCGSFNSLSDEPTKRERPREFRREKDGPSESEDESKRNTSKRKRHHQRRRGPRRRR